MGDNNDNIKVVDMLPPYLSTTAQPADDLIVSETEPESDEEVTIISIQPAPSPSCPSTVLPPKDLSLIEPESNKESQFATVGCR